jgi:hypothetical protein
MMMISELSQANYFLWELNSSKAARIPWLLDCYTILTPYGFTEIQCSLSFGFEKVASRLFDPF